MAAELLAKLHAAMQLLGWGTRFLFTTETGSIDRGVAYFLQSKSILDHKSHEILATADIVFIGRSRNLNAVSLRQAPFLFGFGLGGLGRRLSSDAGG